MLTTAHIKAAIAALALIVLIGAGWTARGWYEDSKDLAAAAAIEKSREVMRELANQVSTSTENAIREIRVENTTITKAVEREIVEKPVYRDCVLPDTGRLRANQARRGAAAGKSDNPVSGAAAAP